MAEEEITPDTSETTLNETTARPELSIDEFLQKIDLSTLADLFKEEEVTMDILRTFNDDDLRNIGITKYGPRKKILNSIASLEHKGKIIDSIYWQTVTISKFFSSTTLIPKIRHHYVFIPIRSKRSGSHSIFYIHFLYRCSTNCSTNTRRTIGFPSSSSSNL